MFDNRKPVALLLGRFQPFHEGHLALAANAIATVGQVLIAVKDVGGSDADNPYSYGEVRTRIRTMMQDAGFEGKYEIMLAPNITEVHYGRSVGYKILYIDLPPEVQAISATKIRDQERQS